MSKSGLPLYLEKSGIWEILKKTWNLEQKSLKNLEFLTTFTCLVVKFRFDTNLFKKFLLSSNICFIKKHI